jgi:4-alpha-glucanotransferase
MTSVTRHGETTDLPDSVSGPPADPEPELWPDLIEAARAYRIATEYYDWRGRRVEVPARTLVTVLAAFGVDARSPETCRKALAQLREARFRPLPPCVVIRQEPPAPAPQRYSTARQGAAVREVTPLVTVHAPSGTQPTLWIALEDGGRRYDVAMLSSEAAERRGLDAFIFALPAALPIGWHTLYARIGGEILQCPLAVAPHRLTTPTRRRAWGYTLQLHSVRSRRSWGMGDLGDLAEFAAIAGHDLGAGFLVVNPLHGGSGVPPIDPSPYLPATRRYPDPIHLRIESVPEYAYAPADVREQVDQLGAELRKRDLSDDLIDRDLVWEGKAKALRLLYGTPRTAGRSAAYRAYLRREGRALRRHATWLTLVQVYGSDQTRWPEALRRPNTSEVAAFADTQQAEIDFHCWLQWLLDEQLAAVRVACAHSGMTYGVFHDLAVGAQAGGADTWADADVYAEGVTIGAPADEFNQLGQDWSSRPWRPDRLAESGYLPYRQMLAGVLRHADGLRMDHVMGLFRLWWVPAGASPADGTYVSYEHEAMLAVLTLEAHRAGAVVIGEDLGTVEPWVRDALQDRGIFGTNVLWFERDGQAAPMPPGRWRENCLAAVTTHDLPPTAALLTGAHLELRDRLGLLTRPLEEEKEADRAGIQSWLDLLRACGLLRDGAGEQETVEALHRFLAWTPARLIGVYLPDAVGDMRPHNLPGTSGDTYPNWRLPLADSSGRPVLLDELAGHPRVRSLARVLRALA